MTRRRWLLVAILALLGGCTVIVAVAGSGGEGDSPEAAPATTTEPATTTAAPATTAAQDQVTTTTTRQDLTAPVRARCQDQVTASMVSLLAAALAHPDTVTVVDTYWVTMTSPDTDGVLRVPVDLTYTAADTGRDGQPFTLGGVTQYTTGVMAVEVLEDCTVGSIYWYGSDGPHMAGWWGRVDAGTQGGAVDPARVAQW